MNTLPLPVDFVPVVLRKVEENKAYRLRSIKAMRVKLHVSTAEDNDLYVQRLVTKTFNVTWEQMTQKKRTREVVEARQAYCYVNRMFLQKTFKALGREFGQDHTTAMHATQTAEDLIATNYEPFVTKINEVISQCINNDQYK